jgi:hypothetical protein
MKRKIGDNYTYIENGNSVDSKTLGYATNQELRIPVEFVLYIPEIGPSGVAINDKKYRILVNGDYVNKTNIELTGIPIGSPLGLPETILTEISDNVEGIPNRIYTGQELLFSYKGKPTGILGYDYGPSYGLSAEENKRNMESDVIIQVQDVFSDGSITYIDVLSPIHLYWIDDIIGSEIVTNFNARRSLVENKNYPSDLYVTNLKISGGMATIDFHFKNSVVSATKFAIAYRRKRNEGNTSWTYIDDVLKSPYTLTNLQPNEFYEIRVMTFFDDEYSIFSPKITFKTF